MLSPFRSKSSLRNRQRRKSCKPSLESLEDRVLLSADLAYNPAAMGYPTPLESDRRWGGGSYPWDIVDGLKSYSYWAHGLAFTGGHTDGPSSGGWIEPAGPRQATIDFGKDETFHEVIIWDHGNETDHVPAQTTIQYWDGVSWVDLPARRLYGTMQGGSGYSSNSDVYTFPDVTASKVRYAFDNSGNTLSGAPIVHGWIYEFEVFANDPPVLAPIADQTVMEGGSLAVPITATDFNVGDTLAYSLDSAPAGASIDPNTGVFTFTPIDGPAIYTATVRVTDDGSPALSDTKSFAITVDNVAPTANLAGPNDSYQGVRGQTRTFTLGATDPSPVDQAAGFTYSINWGDGTSETDSGLSGAQVSHVYDAAGAYAVTMTATDKDGGTSVPVTLPVAIRIVEQQGAILAVGGTPNADTFLFAPGSATGTVKVTVDGALQGVFTTGQVMAYGAAGNDTVNIQGTSGADAFTINSASVSVKGVTIAADSVEVWNVNGGAGNDTFAINGSGQAANINGGADNDRFVIATGIVFDGTIDGGTGVDTLVGGNTANTWKLTGSNSGTLNGSAFTGIENPTGGTNSDAFQFQPGGGVTGLINGGLGIDTLDYSAYGGPVAIDLQTRTGTGLDHFTLVEALVGSAGSDALTGPDAPTTWLITDNNAGRVSSYTFSSFENLAGGMAADVFKFSNGKGVSGTIDGGGGGDTLNYAAYTTPVTVNLATGAATGVAGRGSEIQVVIGGSGDDSLTGDAGNSVLVGGAGNDTLTAGSSLTLLIGGAGNDVLTGGPADDILIGGATSYDANASALLAIMKEWQRTDETYQQRIDHLRGTTAGGLNGAFYLKATTVKDDGKVDSLTGGPGMDWFWADLAEITDLAAGEQVN
jgi:PKD domain/RTX calcium-binding nonapeptide repeat (4 copies)